MDENKPRLFARPGPAYAYTEQHIAAEGFDVPLLKQHSITLATAVRAAWGFVLAKMASQQDVTFGEIIAGPSLLVAKLLNRVQHPALMLVDSS